MLKQPHTTCPEESHDVHSPVAFFEGKKQLVSTTTRTTLKVLIPCELQQISGMLLGIKEQDFVQNSFVFHGMFKRLTPKSQVSNLYN